MKKEISYSEYLFSRLVCEYKQSFREMEYDTFFASIPILYKEFEESAFNDPSEPEYECIEKYIKSKLNWIF
jgi:hypothetical protein